MVDNPGECTIVIVSFRHERFVESCLDSIMAQTEPCRAILFDNASPDRTLAVAQEWAQRHPNTVEIRDFDDNIGLCRRLNQALAAVDTEYFAYISADDTMEPTRVATMLSEFREAGRELVCVYSDAYICDEVGVRAAETAQATVRPPPDPDLGTFHKLLETNWIPTPTVMLRTSAVRAVGGYDESLPFEDYDMWLRLARVGSFRRLPVPLATARHVAGTSLTAEVVRAEDLDWVRASIEILAKHVGIDAATDAAIARKTLAKAHFLIDRTGRPSPALWAVARASGDWRLRLKLLLASARLRFGPKG